jgi:hypothetical protein
MFFEKYYYSTIPKCVNTHGLGRHFQKRFYRYRSKNQIYNKETQLITYADDIDIVGRSQSAVWDANLALEREAAKVKLKVHHSQDLDPGGACFRFSRTKK